MLRGTLFSRLVRAPLLLLALPVMVGATGLTTNLEYRVLAAHNRERVAMGIAPLRWDPTLAASAQSWADYLARTGEFRHAPDRHRDPEGENIWAGSRGYFSAEAMIDGWIREKQNFKYGRFPNNSVTGRVEDVGHYTQLMWRRTGEVGCAIAHSPREDLLVCRYAEAGNYIGEKPF